MEVNGRKNGGPEPAPRPSPEPGSGFGRGKRARTWVAVLANGGLALLVWLLGNVLLSQPELRVSLDLTPDARFTLGDGTKALIRELRASGKKCTIHSFFLRLDPRDPMRRIQGRVVQLVRDLLDRLSYLGGDQLIVEHHDIYKEIRSARKARDALGVTRFNTLVLELGARKRQLGVLEDLADIELPEEDRTPGQAVVPVLRSFQGEEAIASALRALLNEQKLRAYWLTGHGEGSLKDVSGDGYDRLARQLVLNGFENRILDLDKEGGVPPDCRLLLVLQPERPLFPRHAAMLRSYLDSGGRMLLCLGYVPGVPAQPSWGALLGPLGVEIGEGLLCNGLPPAGGKGTPVYGVQECLWLDLRRGIHGSHPATRFLAKTGRSLSLPWARPLRLAEDPPEGVRGEILLSTNPFAWVEEVPPDRPPDFRPAREADLGVRHLAAALTIQRKAGRESGPPTEAASREGRAVILAAVAFRNGERLLERNLDLALGISQWLVEERAFVPAKARNLGGAFLDVPPSNRRQARLFQWAPPLVFLLAAFFMMFWRRRA